MGGYYFHLSIFNIVTDALLHTLVFTSGLFELLLPLYQQLFPDLSHHQGAHWIYLKNHSQLLK